jgi:hypothetical protein
VLAEVIKKAERMARFRLARTTPVRLRDLGGTSAVLSRERWAVACAIDGARSVRDLAWTCGLALCEAIECVGRLIQASVCVPQVLSPTAVLPSARTDLPQRVPQARQDRPLMSAPVWPADMPASDDFTSVQPELLRRAWTDCAGSARTRQPDGRGQRPDLAGVRRYPFDDLAHPVLQHSDVQAAGPDDGHDRAVAGRVDGQVSDLSWATICLLPMSRGADLWVLSS